MIQFGFEENHIFEASHQDESYRQRFRRLLSGDLNFQGDNSVFSTHSWHAFPAKFPPQLPRLFIRELTRKGDMVLDPMMGSGTTLIESLLLDRYAIGCDIDPLSLKIAEAKLKSIDRMRASRIGKKIIEKARNNLKNNPHLIEKELKNRFGKKESEFISYWFAETTQYELMALLCEIESLDDAVMRDFFTLIFSAIIITKSGGVSLSRDLAHTRPHKVEKTPACAFTEFQKRLQRNLQNILFKKENCFALYEADAQKLPLADNSADLIVTSPPYANHAIDYMRAHKFSLVWLGYGIDELSEIRRKYIGGDSVRNFCLSDLPPYSQLMVERLAESDKKKSLALHRYYSEMTQTLSEMRRVLKPGHAAIVVVGTSVMRGVNVETHHCLSEIGVQAGFELVHIGTRSIDRDKRMMPARADKTAQTQIEARMHEEYIIGFLKPESNLCR